MTVNYLICAVVGIFFGFTIGLAVGLSGDHFINKFKEPQVEKKKIEWVLTHKLHPTIVEYKCKEGEQL